MGWRSRVVWAVGVSSLIALVLLLRGGADPAEVPAQLNVPAVNASWTGVEGTLHFLFTAHSSLPHAPLWAKFFSEAPAGKYILWLHCVEHSSCKGKDFLPGMRLIPTVPSLYFWDLLSAQVALLNMALQCLPPGTNEKFVFVSDSTLPVKRYGVVHEELFRDKRSYLCPFPDSHWNPFKLDGDQVIVPKIHQWLVLNRKHAERLAKEYIPGHLIYHPWFHGEALVIEKDALRGATDESSVFTLIFGPYRSEDPEQQMSPETCKTLVLWDHQSQLQELQKQEGNNLTLIKYHPGVINELSSEGMILLSQSPHLFARKFSPTARLPGFAQIMFGMPPLTRGPSMLPSARCAADPAPSGPFMLHFLFILSGPWPAGHQEVWQQFFSAAPKERWSVQAHCLRKRKACKESWPKEWPAPLKCDRNASKTPCGFLAAQVCLLKASMREGFYVQEKFIVLDERALPVRSFRKMYRILNEPTGPLERQTSDICIRPPERWHKIPDSDLSFVSHSPFTILAGMDARMIVKLWRQHSELCNASYALASHSWHKEKQEDDLGTARRVVLPSNASKVNPWTELEEAAPFFLLHGPWPPRARTGAYAQPMPLCTDLAKQFTNKKDQQTMQKDLFAQSRCRCWDPREEGTDDSDLFLRLESTRQVEIDTDPQGEGLLQVGPEAVSVLAKSGFFFVSPVAERADMTSLLRFVD